MVIIIHVLQQLLLVYSLVATMLAFYVLSAVVKSPGILDMLAYAIEEDHPFLKLTQRQFAWIIIATVSLLWPLTISSVLDNDGPWKG